jgi:hypothetical protein
MSINIKIKNLICIWVIMKSFDYISRKIIDCSLIQILFWRKKILSHYEGNCDKALPIFEPIIKFNASQIDANSSTCKTLSFSIELKSQ